MTEGMGGGDVAKKSGRRSIPHDVRATVLHEAGYRCAVPACRTILTLEVHHIVYVSEGGPDTPENLLPLCGNCHGLHHMGKIATESIRAWKFLLLAANEAFDRRMVDVLLALALPGGPYECSADKVLDLAPLVASGMIRCEFIGGQVASPRFGKFFVSLSDKGRLFVEAWKRGDQRAAVDGLPAAP